MSKIHLIIVIVTWPFPVKVDCTTTKILNTLYSWGNLLNDQIRIDNRYLKWCFLYFFSVSSGLLLKKPQILKDLKYRKWSSKCVSNFRGP